MPMRSFTIPETSMRLSADAVRSIRRVTTKLEAERFLKMFGSHIPSGQHTLGGVFFRKVSLTTESEVSSFEAFKSAGNQLSAHVGGSGFGVSGSAGYSYSNAVKSGSTTFSSNAERSASGSASVQGYFESSVVCLGPNAATPEEFAQALAKNSGTWACIERGNLGALIPVWNKVEDYENEVKNRAYFRTFKEKPSVLLKNAWMEIAAGLYHGIQTQPEDKLAYEPGVLASNRGDFSILDSGFRRQ